MQLNVPLTHFDGVLRVDIWRTFKLKKEDLNSHSLNLLLNFATCVYALEITPTELQSIVA